MKRFRAYLEIEDTQFFSKRNIVAMALLWIMTLYFVQMGVNRYEKSLDAKKEFDRVERLKVKSYFNYTYYGSMGMRSYFHAGPASVFFKDSLSVSELTAYFNSGDKLDLNGSVLGSNIFRDKKGAFCDFPGIILVIGSLIALFMGYDAMQRRGFLASLASMAGFNRVFSSMVLSRIILLNGYALFLFGSSLALVGVNGIVYTTPDFIRILYFLLLSMVFVLFFFAMGMAVGSVKKKKNAQFLLFGLWVLYVIIIPGIVYSNIEADIMDVTSNFIRELAKSKILMDFERQVIDDTGQFKPEEKNTTPRQRQVEHYWRNQFKQIQAEDAARYKEMRTLVDNYYSWSALFPTTFYSATATEASGGGYGAILRFYHYTTELKAQFTRYYLDKKFYTNEDRLEDFVNLDENIMPGLSMLPGNFAFGFGLTLAHALVLLCAAYIGLRRRLYVPAADDTDDLEGMKILFKSNEVNSWRTSGSHLANILFALFSGKTKPEQFRDSQFVLKVDEDHLTSKTNDGTFIYICHPNEIPGDIRAGQLVQLFAAFIGIPIDGIEAAARENSFEPKPLYKKKTGDLQDHEAGELLLAAASVCHNDTCVLDHLEPRLNTRKAMRYYSRWKQMAENDTLLILLSSTIVSLQPGEAEHLSPVQEDRGLDMAVGLERLKQKHARTDDATEAPTGKKPLQDARI